MPTSRLTWYSLPETAIRPNPTQYSKTVSDNPQTGEAIVIGLDADMTHNCRVSGEAIRRGAELAIKKWNAKGGVLGIPIQLSIRDHRGNPARGVDNIHAFAENPNLVAVLGGCHTPVAVEELQAIHKHKIIYLGPWAAGTQIVDNGHSPNYVFRVAARDAFAGEFLVRSALEQGHEKVGLLLEQTAWGKSNELAIILALQKRQLQPTSTAWFIWDQVNIDKQVQMLTQSGATAIILVANVTEGANTISAMASRPAEKRLPIFSHWGLLNGPLPDHARRSLASVDLAFLQTFSFDNPKRPQAARDFGIDLCTQSPQFECPNEIEAAFASAHAFDLVNMLCEAILSAGTRERSAVRDALESLPHHLGVVREYSPPFTVHNHDALDVSDLQLMTFDADQRPVAYPKTRGTK